MRSGNFRIWLLLALSTPALNLAIVQKAGAPDNADVIARIKAYLPAKPIIVEAGTYNGADTLELSQLLPTAQIFSFEPVPELFAKAQQLLAACLNVQLYPQALSDRTGTATLYTSEKKHNPRVITASSSLLAPKEHLRYAPDILFKRQISVATITLDDWCRQQQITQIDFLKLDIQGYELLVLQAATTILPTIRAILVEVEFVEAYQNQYLYADVKAWLEQQGFELDCLYVNSWFGDALFIRR